MREVVIVAATRTAIGAFQGTLSSVPAVELGAALVRRLLDDSGVEGYQIDEVILGQVLTAGAGQNPAWQTALKAGLPHTVPAFTLNKVCGSGLKAAQLAYQAIAWRQRRHSDCWRSGEHEPGTIRDATGLIWASSSMGTAGSSTA